MSLYGFILFTERCMVHKETSGMKEGINNLELHSTDSQLWKEHGVITAPQEKDPHASAVYTEHYQSYLRLIYRKLISLSKTRVFLHNTHTSAKVKYCNIMPVVAKYNPNRFDTQKLKENSLVVIIRYLKQN